MSEQNRPPVVTILGHVDHGKTSLLDFIRKAHVADKEHGGITQAIGAYQAEHQDKLITFIDTPGHAAFEKMRSRGANVADIAVLVVAIDDGIMPQTIEAIKHILNAKVPMIVAVNKVDLPGINLVAQMERIKKQLSDNQVLVEEYGGDTPIIQISAKTGLGVDALLEMILLVAEVNDFKGDASLAAAGVVIESKIDKSKGPIASAIIKNGTLKRGDTILLNGIKSKVRGIIDYNGKNLSEAGPSTPVELSGLEIVPAVGAIIGDEALVGVKPKEIKSLLAKLREDKSTTLNVIVKADTQGSIEAIEGALEKFNIEAEHVKVVLVGTGDISENDVATASATRGIVIGFNVKASNNAMKVAENETVLVRTYNIIYELIEELEDVVDGMLKVGALEETLGLAQIVAEFPYGKNERIAGVRVQDGQITKGPRIKILRGDEIIGEGKIKSIKHLREEVNRLETGDEGGFMFDTNIPFEIGDVVQSFRTL